MGNSALDKVTSKVPHFECLVMPFGLTNVLATSIMHEDEEQCFRSAPK